MLTLRLQRTGRKKLPQYRLVAQEHRLSPSSGRVSAYLGNYNPHTKEFNFKKDEIEKHLANGAQPSNRVAILLKKAKIKLPSWVTISQKPEKKKEEPVVEEAAKPVEAETESTEEPVAESEEKVAAEQESPVETEDAPAEEVAPAAPAEDASSEENK